MRKLTCFILILVLFSCDKKNQLANEVTISTVVLKDKIRGGWAGQTIGCSYGGPTEFKYKGTMIQDYQPILWYDNYIKETFEQDPGLYDDIYLDITFVQVLERLGFQAPADSFAIVLANEKYKLWHANQAGRYNVLNGIMPPASGYWKNNPHADDIDFQIEADFAGTMSPGMINATSDICDRIGHIMNYGDGWYGGVYMAALYSLAFVSEDMEFVVSESLKRIPEKSKFYQCISDVIKWHKQYPKDWKQCWFEVEKKHTSEKGCPEGVFASFNIDASLNAAYVVMGLLYGEKDFFRTIDIATRCGQDSDCSPATAGGILGVMIGYNKIPKYWKPAIEKVENLKFPYMQITLNELYALSYKHALKMIESNGGKVEKNQVVIKTQKPQVLRWEESFTGVYPKEKRLFNKDLYNEDINLNFIGTGIVVLGNVKRIIGENNNYIALLDAYLDGKKIEQIKMPFDYITRKYDIFYKYEIPYGNHNLKIVWTNPNPDFKINLKDVVIYSDKPYKTDSHS